MQESILSTIEASNKYIISRVMMATRLILPLGLYNPICRPISMPSVSNKIVILKEDH